MALLLGKPPIDNEEEIFKKGMDYSSLCAKGVHPKEYEREQARIEEEKERLDKEHKKKEIEIKKYYYVLNKVGCY